jgi:hypothetical protein
MPVWDKSNKPKSILDPAEQSKTILTDEGWVRLISYTDRHGNVRTKKEVLVSGLGSASPFFRGVNVNAAALLNGAQWPKNEAVDYYITTKKMNSFRLPVLWENVQPTLNGPLNSTQVTNIQDQITRVTAAGGYVILEPHNFGRRTMSEFTGNLTNGSNSVTNVTGIRMGSTNIGVGQTFTSSIGGIAAGTTITAINGTTLTLSANFTGTTTTAVECTTEVIIGETAYVTSAHLANFWGRLATQFPGQTVVYGLMNEPFSQNDAILTSTLNQCIAAIRATGSHNLILVPGNDFTNRYSWRSGATNYTMIQNIVDSQNNWAIDYHVYLDPFSPGNSSTIEAGFMTPVQFFTTWCRANNKRAFVGEFGVAQDAASLTAAKTFLDHVEANKDVFVGWSWWAGGGWWTYDYIYLLDPYASQWDATNPWRHTGVGGTGQATTWAAPRVDKPQMTVLDNYLPITPVKNLLPKSRDFTTYFALSGTIQAGATNGIFGPLSATAYKEDGTATQHGIENTNVVVSPAANTFTVSAIAKKGTRNGIQLSVFSSDFSQSIAARFNLNTGTKMYVFGANWASGGFTAQTMTDMGNGWYYCSFTATLNSSWASVRARAFAYDIAQDTDSFLGTNGNVSFYIEHFQVEVGVTAGTPKTTY